MHACVHPHVRMRGLRGDPGEGLPIESLATGAVPFARGAVGSYPGMGFLEWW